MNSRYETLALQARKLKLTELAPANRETAGNMQDGIQPAAGKSLGGAERGLGRLREQPDCGHNSQSTLAHWAERCSADLLAA